MSGEEGEGLAGQLDLTPSPRLLEVLGDIPYQPWQCVAELIDNAFDDFLADDRRDPADRPTVRVTLPNPNVPEGDEIVCVADNGRGMTEEMLENALKAGYSQKARYGSLGLFGMGFNIATARLGHVTEVRTARAGQGAWLVAEIDFRRMQREKSFIIPLRQEPKEDPSLHGTEITVRRLRPETRNRLRRSNMASRIRERLGDVYSYMLRSPEDVPGLPGTALAGRGFDLYVNGTRVKPQLPCIWSPQRSVSYKGQRIPAVIEINRQLKPGWVCLTCGHWHAVAPDQCLECDSEALGLQERRIVGWVGVQRYLDPNDFGIDLLRNGRKILTSDKSLFDWEHPDTGQVLREYPIEFGATSGGRLVGEVHLDHVPVVYQKNDFQRSSRDWITAVHTIRGQGPLQPKKAKGLGYPENTSPLGRLFSAYRRNDPGTKCLIPGDGKKPLHDRAREWATHFRKGRAGYLTDDKWYEAAEEHDRIAALGKEDLGKSDGSSPVSAGSTHTDTHHTSVTPGEGDDLLSRTGLDGLIGKGSNGQDAQSTRPTKQPETEEERFARYHANARPLHDLSGEVSIDHLGRRKIFVYDTSVPLKDHLGNDTPCVSRSVRGNKIEIYVHSDHEVFREYGRDPRDYAIIQLAEQLRAQANSQHSITRVAADITTRIPDQRLSDAALRERADALLRRIREALVPIAARHAAALWACLPNTEKAAAERTALAHDPDLVWPDTTKDGRFVSYIGAGATAAIVRERPELVLDGQVFTTTWATWSSEEAKERQVSRLGRNLDALSEFLANTDAKSRLELTHIRLTLDMLDQEVRWEEPT